jgi:DNA (cytosine-5)-methyltransferase 1
MADGNLPLDFGQELVVDLFAGGGGASLGIARAYRDPDVAVNHNPVAIAVHTVNHPNTVHHTCDVFEIDPAQATGGRPVGVLWASPDCRHHSKAKGGKPRSKKIRGLAWVVVKWAAACLPRLIHLENVEEFADWGPLLADGSPCKVRKGMTFRRWVRQLERLGYRIEHRELVAADYGAPTIRKRLYVIARRDGRPIVWPKPSHSKTGAGGLPKWRTAAECIDFGLPANSIFGRKKPLADNTQRRVAKGLWRYVLNCAEPFIVGCGGRMGQSPERPVSAPFQTITSKADACIAQPVLAPFLTEHANASNQRVFSADEPLRTQVAQIYGGHFALVAPHITKFRANSIGSGMDEPVHTVTAGGDMARPAGAAHAMGVVSAFLEQANGGFYEGDGRNLQEPVSTVLQAGSQQRLVSAYLVKFYSCGGQWQGATEPMHTVPTKDRMGLVQSVHVPANTLAPELRDRAKACADFLHRWLPEHFAEPADLVLLGDYALVDITLRMLVPRELARAQGFPDSYVLDRGPDGKAITKTDQVRLIGNSVCPDVAEALIRANAADLIALYARAA